jgi:hypothetical protein
MFLYYPHFSQPQFPIFCFLLGLNIFISQRPMTKANNPKTSISCHILRE